MSSLLRSSKFVRHFVSLARNVVTSNRQDIDGSLLQRSQHLVGVFSSNLSTSSLQFRGTQFSVENSVKRLDEDARRTGRISIKEIEDTLNEIKRQKSVSTSHSLMVIRCCGNLVPEESPERRTQLVQEIWSTLEKLGVSLDISHYNALLKVYLENEHKFSPTEFLAKLEKNGIEPNRVTYQRLVSGYCQVGDIAGATKILEFMKEKQIPVSEGVFNALIVGHSKAEDMESAEGILSVMKQASLEPSNETYTALLCGYARLGDSEAVKRLITDCKLKDVLLSDRDILDIACTAAVNNHDSLLDDLLSNIRNSIGYNQEAVNTILQLITKGKDEAAFKVFLTMQTPVMTDNDRPNMSGHILLKQLVKMNRPAEDILKLSERLEKGGHTSYGLSIAIETSFTCGHVELTLDLLRAFQKKGETIKNHFFWPILVTTGKSKQINNSKKILKIMVDEFGLEINGDTIKDYYLPYVESKKPDTLLKDILDCGVRRTPAVKALVAHLISQNNLKEAINLGLQHPRMNLRSVFLNRQLVEALVQTKDVQSVVGLVHIINNNMMERVTEEDSAEGETGVEVEETTAADFPGRFLVNVAANTESKPYTEAVLKEMVAKGLSISSERAEKAESYLQGKQLTSEISELLAKLTSGELTPEPVKTTVSSVQGIPIQRNPVALERIKEKILANGEPQEKLVTIYKSLFTAYCYSENLEGALKIKQEWEENIKEDAPIGFWAQLLRLHCEQNNLEKAKEAWDNILKINPDGQLDSDKILKFARLYCENNMIDEAIKILTSVKGREVKSTSDDVFPNRAASFQLLSTVAEKSNDPEQVKKMLQILVDEKYAEISNVLLGPIMKAYLLKNDLEGALKEFETCVKVYRQTPWKNELTAKFIEKEDTVNLQALVDLSTQVHGEINSLYDLVLCFVECGRIRQARKILETPGLRTRNDRLNLACEKYNKEGQVAPLEGLVEVTKDLPHIDRSEIYLSLLKTYCKGNNTEKALGLWTQMQDEDVHISDEFLRRLGNYLKQNGQPVPFTIPKSGATPENKKKVIETKTETVTSASGIRAAVASKDVEKCLQIVEELKKNDKTLSRNELSTVVELLTQENRLNEAVNLILSQEKNTVPYVRTLNFLTNRLAQEGAIDSMKKLETKLSEDVKKLTSFNNRQLACALTAGKAKEELDKLEKQIDNASTPDEIDELATQFPRGGIFALLNSSPDFYEPVKRIAEKYFNKGISAPINGLCMFQLAEGQTEKATEIFNRYNLANSSQLMFRNVVRTANITENPKLIEELITLVKDCPAVTSEANGYIYSNLVNILVKKGDPSTALSKLEEGLKVCKLENLQRNTLLNLKEALEAQNLPFKYTIPEKLTKDSSTSSSTSSSSSDEEPKKSAAVKH